ncbi:MAG TPA: hypothetical protein VF272_02960 [Candidatus Saccharimonadia bacterium]
MPDSDDRMDPDHRRYIRKVTLPSGKTIEVIDFENASDGMQLTPQVQRAEIIKEEAEATDLRICPECHLDLVYPVSGVEIGSTSWKVELLCPNCWWTATDVFDGVTIERFDEGLQESTEDLIDALRRLARANLEDDFNAFIDAINAGAILPEDF